MLRRHARKMVFDVYCYLTKDGLTEKETVKRTAEATNTSESIVRNSEFLTDTGKKEASHRDRYFRPSVIRTCVHNFHLTNKELPTVEKLRRNKFDSERSLRRILNNLGFRWRKAENNRRLLLEKTNTRLLVRVLRIEFLKTLMKYREEGRSVVYKDV